MRIRIRIRIRISTRIVRLYARRCQDDDELGEREREGERKGETENHRLGSPSSGIHPPGSDDTCDTCDTWQSMAKPGRYDRNASPSPHNCQKKPSYRPYSSEPVMQKLVLLLVAVLALLSNVHAAVRRATFAPTPRVARASSYSIRHMRGIGARPVSDIDRGWASRSTTHLPQDVSLSRRLVISSSHHFVVSSPHRLVISSSHHVVVSRPVRSTIHPAQVRNAQEEGGDPPQGLREVEEGLERSVPRQACRKLCRAVLRHQVVRVLRV